MMSLNSLTLIIPSKVLLGRLFHILLACLHDQIKSCFLKGRLLSSQSEQSEKFSRSPDWLEKSWPSKKATFDLIM